MHAITEFIEKLVTGWVGGLEESGYLGIFILMTVESSFIPFPSEVVMIPAGFLSRQGELNLWGCIAAGTAGSIAGAMINYYLAVSLGRAVLLRFGKYFFIPQEKMLLAETYFEKHGQLTTFVCRLIPVVRQLISIPAGLARMNLFRFCLFTGLGAGIWMVVLTLVGYYFGDAAERLWEENKSLASLAIVAAMVLLVGFYVVRFRMRSRNRQIAAEPATD